jgi:hypothetical protein
VLTSHVSLAHMLMGKQLCSATNRLNYLVSFRPCMLWEVWFTEKIWTNQSVSQGRNWALHVCCVSLLTMPIAET